MGRAQIVIEAPVYIRNASNARREDRRRRGAVGAGAFGWSDCVVEIADGCVSLAFSADPSGIAIRSCAASAGPAPLDVPASAFRSGTVTPRFRVRVLVAYRAAPGRSADLEGASVSEPPAGKVVQRHQETSGSCSLTSPRDEARRAARCS